jgi:hypothetical protein
MVTSIMTHSAATKLVAPLMIYIIGNKLYFFGHLLWVVKNNNILTILGTIY